MSTIKPGVIHHNIQSRHISSIVNYMLNHGSELTPSSEWYCGICILSSADVHLPLLCRALLNLFPSRTGLDGSKDCQYWKVGLKLAKVD